MEAALSYLDPFLLESLIKHYTINSLSNITKLWQKAFMAYLYMQCTRIYIKLISWAILTFLTQNHNECILPKMAKNIVGMHLWSFLPGYAPAPDPERVPFDVTGLGASRNQRCHDSRHLDSSSRWGCLFVLDRYKALYHFAGQGWAGYSSGGPCTLSSRLGASSYSFQD